VQTPESRVARGSGKHPKRAGKIPLRTDSQELTRSLSAERDAAIRWLDLFPRKGGTHLAASVMRRYSKRIAGRFWTPLSRWIGQTKSASCDVSMLSPGWVAGNTSAMARQKPARANTPMISVAGF